MNTKQGRQADILAANEIATGIGLSASILPHAADSAHGPTLNRATLARGEFEVFTDGYASGYAAGLARGRAETEAEMAVAWSALAASIRSRASMLTHAELQRRRAT